MYELILRLENPQVSFWYLAPTLGETFLEAARKRLHIEYQTGGLWSGKAWGHPVWLLSYRDVPVEADTIPSHLLDRKPAAPASLGQLVLERPALLQRFAGWLRALQPDVWKEIRQMATASSQSIFDWEKVGEVANLEEVIPYLPADRVIQILGVERTIETIGLKSVIETVGLPRLIEVSGAEKVLRALFPGLSEEKLQEMIRQQQQQG